jgi:RNA polymerase sigma-70 factor, ECF subfamily
LLDTPAPDDYPQIHVNKTVRGGVKVMGIESEQLISRAKKGDMDAFAALFEGLRSMVFLVASKLVGPVDADDVVMETFLKAWKAIPNFRGDSSLKTWVYRMTHNCAMDLIRSRQRRAERHVQADGEGERDLLADMPDPAAKGADELVAESELAHRVGRALQQLPEAHRVAVALRYTDGLSYTEIAAATGVSIGTVMSRLFNGKRKLRRILEADDLT